MVISICGAVLDGGGSVWSRLENLFARMLFPLLCFVCSNRIHRLMHQWWLVNVVGGGLVQERTKVLSLLIMRCVTPPPPPSFSNPKIRNNFAQAQISELPFQHRIRGKHQLWRFIRHVSSLVANHFVLLHLVDHTHKHVRICIGRNLRNTE